jgi:hypothetical protein
MQARAPPRLADLDHSALVKALELMAGHEVAPVAAGGWVHERLLQMPAARGLEDLPLATSHPAPVPPLEGYSFEGYRNADGSVGTRNILAITQTVQCVAGVTAFAVQRIKAELLPKYPHVDDVVALEHGYGCGVAIDAPRCGDPHPHAAPHQPEPQLRRCGDGGQPGLREAAARAAAAAGQHRAEGRARPAAAARWTWSACRTTPTSASCRWSITSCARPKCTSAPERAPPRNRAGQ